MSWEQQLKINYPEDIKLKKIRKLKRELSLNLSFYDLLPLTSISHPERRKVLVRKIKSIEKELQDLGYFNDVKSHNKEQDDAENLLST